MFDLLDALASLTVSASHRSRFRILLHLPRPHQPEIPCPFEPLPICLQQTVKTRVARYFLEDFSLRSRLKAPTSDPFSPISLHVCQFIEIIIISSKEAPQKRGFRFDSHGRIFSKLVEYRGLFIQALAKQTMKNLSARMSSHPFHRRYLSRSPRRWCFFPRAAIRPRVTPRTFPGILLNFTSACLSSLKLYRIKRSRMIFQDQSVTGRWPWSLPFSRIKRNTRLRWKKNLRMLKNFGSRSSKNLHLWKVFLEIGHVVFEIFFECRLGNTLTAKLRMEHSVYDWFKRYSKVVKLTEHKNYI